MRTYLRKSLLTYCAGGIWYYTIYHLVIELKVPTSFVEVEVEVLLRSQLPHELLRHDIIHFPLP